MLAETGRGITLGFEKAPPSPSAPVPDRPEAAKPDYLFDSCWSKQNEKGGAVQPRDSVPKPLEFIAFAPERRDLLGAAFTAPAIPAPGPALGSHSCVALSSAQVLTV